MLSLVRNLFMTPTSVGTPRHITSRHGLLTLRRELIERMGLTTMILVLFCETSLETVVGVLSYVSSGNSS